MISRDAAKGFLVSFAGAVAGRRDLLTELDRAIGDADHGTNLDRGLTAVVEKLETAVEPDVGALFTLAGRVLISTVGGASGPLYGSLFLKMGLATAGQREVNLKEFAAAFRKGVEAVMKLGKAKVGDKTMVDALVPALEALEVAAEGGLATGAALEEAARAAEGGAVRTIPLVARKGRASYLGERSAGHQDPGATSSQLLLRAAAEALRDP